MKIIIINISHLNIEFKILPLAETSILVAVEERK